MPRPALGYRLVDVDNHCYEPDDCCPRRLEARFRDRAVHVETQAGGAREWRFGAKRFGFHRGVRDQALRPGALRALFGSDWPHPEGVPQPLDFLAECEGLEAPELRRVLRENTAELLGLAA